MVSKLRAIVLLAGIIIVLSVLSFAPLDSITGLFTGPPNCTEITQTFMVQIPYERELNFAVVGYSQREVPSSSDKETVGTVSVQNLDTIEGQFTVSGLFKQDNSQSPMKKTLFIAPEAVGRFEFTFLSPPQAKVDFSFDVRSEKIPDLKDETQYRNVTTCS